MEQITFKRKGKKIVIEIPFDILEHIANNKPDFNAKVLSKSLFAEDIMYELENNLGLSESGLTGFQELVDQAIEAVYESGAESIEYNDDEE